MQQILIIIHFLSFSAAIGAGIANLILGARMASLPTAAMPQIGAYRLTLGNISALGLILLWVTGLLMISNLPDTNLLSNPLFVAKIIVVILLTLISVAANITVFRARKAGMPPDAARMKKLGTGGVVAAIIALMLAVLTFG